MPVVATREKYRRGEPLAGTNPNGTKSLGRSDALRFSAAYLSA